MSDENHIVPGHARRPPDAAVRRLAEERSFTKWSALLKLAQSWLSTRIRSLEEDLGVALFDRRLRQVALTADG